jgi:hypothetical protein
MLSVEHINRNTPVTCSLHSARVLIVACGVRGAQKEAITSGSEHGRQPFDNLVKVRRPPSPRDIGAMWPSTNGSCAGSHSVQEHRP